MDGREYGTFVFPDADFKLYLDAPVIERMRRNMQRKNTASQTPITNINQYKPTHEDIQEFVTRDRRDIERNLTPIRLPKDAIIIHTSRTSAKYNADMLYRMYLNKVSSQQRQP